MNRRDIYREVGQRIRRFRKGAGRTQHQLANQIGVSRASIANIESGRQNFMLHYVYAIAEALELDTPISLLPGAHEGITASADVAKVPVPQKGLTDKQREEVIQLMGGRLDDHGGTTTGERP